MCYFIRGLFWGLDIQSNMDSSNSVVKLSVFQNALFEW